MPLARKSLLNAPSATNANLFANHSKNAMTSMAILIRGTCIADTCHSSRTFLKPPLNPFNFKFKSSFSFPIEKKKKNQINYSRAWIC